MGEEGRPLPNCLWAKQTTLPTCYDLLAVEKSPTPTTLPRHPTSGPPDVKIRNLEWHPFIEQGVSTSGLAPRLLFFSRRRFVRSQREARSDAPVAAPADAHVFLPGNTLRSMG